MAPTIQGSGQPAYSAPVAPIAPTIKVIEKPMTFRRRCGMTASDLLFLCRREAFTSEATRCWESIGKGLSLAITARRASESERLQALIESLCVPEEGHKPPSCRQHSEK
ncbi:hypothetical protein [Pseudomonas taiwanensis]|uniref:Uncharacterized protein n=1 Tax=Pseudomonas taiwanensis TaxID=470150 RepID=A0ABR6V870_9PSED|nr:hypothetical protein [Pseudomonas taiwanensis]MBC3476667.1 hypothetical protein [Pseudomonas taiwanensis]